MAMSIDQPYFSDKKFPLKSNLKENKNPFGQNEG
jgi:hypothetical protein